MNSEAHKLFENQPALRNIVATVSKDYRGKQTTSKDNQPLGICSITVRLPEQLVLPRSDGQPSRSRNQLFTIQCQRPIAGDDVFDMFMKTPLGAEVKFNGYLISQGCSVGDFGKHLGSIEIVDYEILTTQQPVNAPA